LLAHPSVAPLTRPSEHGARYLDSSDARTERWYGAWFPSGASRARRAARLQEPIVVGEASPYYLFHPLAPRRAAKAVPRARVVVLLRNPVERAFSHWRQQRRKGAEQLSFEDALAAEPRRIAGEEQALAADPGYRSYTHEHQSYAAQSEYALLLERWLRYYDRDQMMIASSEDFFRDPRGVLASTWRFLGLDPDRGGELSFPSPGDASGDRLAAATRLQLAERFVPGVAELESLLDRSFGWSLRA
jgi:hypothetical protein